jgi:nitrogen fixation-related uncharacterized protein
MLIYMIGAFGIAMVTAGLFTWALISKHFQEDEKMKKIILEEDEEK